jgi:hypothetical protein
MKAEFEGAEPQCPVSGAPIGDLGGEFPSIILKGYSEAEFLADFPSFAWAELCPASGAMTMGVTQAHLDAHVNGPARASGARRETVAGLSASMPNVTIRPSQAMVVNPYTGEKIKEITLRMLLDAGTTWREHVEKYATIVLGAEYEQGVTCPFTGRRSRSITADDLRAIGRTPREFYAATCQYPTRRYRVRCAVCGEMVDSVWSHLESGRHGLTLEQYKERFPKYPLSSPDGMVPCPVTGRLVPELSQPYLNRIGGEYTMADFRAEFSGRTPRCPATGCALGEVGVDHPSAIMAGYTEAEFLADFPSFPAERCPLTGQRTLGMTQARLNATVNAKREGAPPRLKALSEGLPNYTMKPRQVAVLNPYTGRMVPEITLKMLRDAGTTWKEHMEKHAQIALDKYYAGMVICPFTGRKTHMIKKTDIEALGKTTWDFYAATCLFPMRKYQVQCAICGEWVDNVWSHLESKRHSFAKSMTINEFEGIYGTYATKVVVRTNSYVENDAGDSIHVADLFPDDSERIDFLELEDSLLGVARDDMDRRIARSIRGASTLEDIFYSSAEIRDVTIPFEFKSGMTRATRDAVRDAIGVSDFDLAKPPSEGSRLVCVMLPGRDAIRRRLSRMIEASDLCKNP